MVTVYRSLVPVVDERVAQFHARQAHERDAIDVARRVLATRVGLTLGGGTAIAFGARAPDAGSTRASRCLS
jgi:hypothetical protein